MPILAATYLQPEGIGISRDELGLDLQGIPPGALNEFQLIGQAQILYLQMFSPQLFQFRCRGLNETIILIQAQQAGQGHAAVPATIGFEAAHPSQQDGATGRIGEHRGAVETPLQG